MMRSKLFLWAATAALSMLLLAAFCLATKNIYRVCAEVGVTPVQATVNRAMFIPTVIAGHGTESFTSDVMAGIREAEEQCPFKQAIKIPAKLTAFESTKYVPTLTFVSDETAAQVPKETTPDITQLASTESAPTVTVSSTLKETPAPAPTAASAEAKPKQAEVVTATAGKPERPKLQKAAAKLRDSVGAATCKLNNPNCSACQKRAAEAEASGSTGCTSCGNKSSGNSCSSCGGQRRAGFRRCGGGGLFNRSSDDTSYRTQTIWETFRFLPGNVSIVTSEIESGNTLAAGPSA